MEIHVGFKCDVSQIQGETADSRLDQLRQFYRQALSRFQQWLRDELPHLHEQLRKHRFRKAELRNSILLEGTEADLQRLSQAAEQGVPGCDFYAIPNDPIPNAALDECFPLNEDSDGE